MTRNLLGWVMAAVALLPGPARAEGAPSVAIFRTEAKAEVKPDTADLLTEYIVAEARASGVFSSVATPLEVDVRLGAGGQEQLRKCANDACTLIDVELAGSLGVSHLLVSTLGKLGGTYVLALKLLDLRTALEVGSERTMVEQERDLPEAAVQATRRVLVAAGFKPAHAPRSSARDEGFSPLQLGTLAGAGVAGVGGLLLLAAALLTVGVAEGLVAAATTVYVPTPTRTYRDRVAWFNGVAVGGALVGAGLGTVGVIFLVAAAALGAGAAVL
ncbi:MAG: hypothetical protein AB2A00_14715 [Myxococcota bacterium]